MKFTGFVRVAKLDNGKPKFVMASKATFEPLRNSAGDALATVQFGVEFEVPDEALEVPLQAQVPILHVKHAVTAQEVHL